jgi:DNA-binding transcriptional regulator YdaS (Cro superfamily)
MDPKLIIERLGGTAAVARLFKIQPPSVSEWKRKGIPTARMQFIALARPDVLRPAANDSSSTDS